MASPTTPKPAPGGCGQSELFMSVTSDEAWRSGMALGFALKNLEDYPVTIFLNVEAVRIAVKQSVYKHDVYAQSGKTNNEVRQELISAGARVIVCPNCLDRSGFKPHELIPGAYLGGPIPEILHCSSVQLSY
jgi:predicted peroxiredoxin